MKYPIDCVSDMDKIEFCYIAQEKLREEHNANGENFRNLALSSQEWDSYLKDSFFPTQGKISMEIVDIKERLKKSKRFSVDLKALE